MNLKKPANLFVCLACLVVVVSLSANAQYLGVTCGYQYSSQLVGPITYPGQYNIGMYNPGGGSRYDTNNPTWSTWVEQLAQAGVDYVCPNVTGSWPNTNTPPTMIAAMVNAVNQRGLAAQLKFALFDDNAASWCAQYNQSLGNGYDYAVPMDLSDTNTWKFIYDYNYKVFYQTVPDANRFKINGRPPIIIWSSGPLFITNAQGNLSRALMYVRQCCQRDFGFNPFIVDDGATIQHDSTCGNPGVLDGLQSWFIAGPSGPSYSLDTYSNAIGVCCAEFQHPGQSGFLDPNHGQLFENGLSKTVGAGALLTLCEGFTDYEEDAAMWRARNLDTNGNVLNYTNTLYDYPNQRINILRKHSRNPFPTTLLYEAEGCDYFGGANGGNGRTNFYRNGNIAIETNNDVYPGWDIGWIQSGEWFEWEQVPLNGSPHFQVRIASTNSTSTGHFVIDGVAQPSQTLPNTGGMQTWATYDFGAYGNYTNSYHTVRFVSDNGGINFNWWQFSGPPAGSLGDPNIKYIGRWDFSDPTQYVSYWGGAYIKVNFSGTTAQIKLGHSSNYYYQIDGGSWTTLTNVNGTVNLTPTPLANGTHTLSVAQGKDYDYVFNFQGLILDAGANTSLPAVSTNLIEFIGDSITAGYTCAQADVSDYAWVCSENLGVEHTQIAYPGVDLVTTTNHGTGQDVQYFKEQSFNYPSSPAWDFTTYSARLVVINLGQNDIGANGIPLSEFQNDYTNFMAGIRTNYPNADIFALRPFSGVGAAQVQAAVAARNAAGDPKVHYIDTTGWLGSYPGPDWDDGVHPSVAGHILIASQLQPILSPYINGIVSTNYTTSTSEAGGQNWTTGTYWSSGLAPAGGYTYEALSGALLRPPLTASSAGSPIVFGGDSLKLDAGAGIRLKSSGAPTPGYFTFSDIGAPLILNGGALANGDDFAATINSPVWLVADSAIYAAVDATTANDMVNGVRKGFRNYIFKGGLLGTNNLTLGNAILYNNPAVSVGVTPNFIIATNSTYGGNIMVTAGWLQAGAAGALGSGNLTLAGGGATNGVNGPVLFDATAGFTLAGTLTVQNTNSVLLLDTNLTFGGAVIDGVPLGNGRYTAAQINARTGQANVVDGSGQNLLTVGMEVGAPMLAGQLAGGGRLVMTWTNAGGAGLQSATNVAGPWTPVAGAASPYTNAILPQVPALFFRLQ